MSLLETKSSYETDAEAKKDYRRMIGLAIVFMAIILIGFSLSFYV